MSNPLKLKIAYLYPDILQSFCDEANIKAFVARSNWRDINVQVNVINSNDKLQASKYDFFYIGGSNIRDIEQAHNFLIQNKQELKVAHESNVPMLAVNCGYLLLGNFYQLHNKTQIETLGILDVDSIASKKHHYGSVSGICEFLKNKSVVGFENHAIVSHLKTNVAPFLILDNGTGNNGQDKTEGARSNNAVGTYIISPLLAQNPHLCDFFIATALRIKYKCRIPLAPLCDDIEWYSHNYMLENK